MKFRGFTRPEFLRGIGRELLGQLFGRFSDELAAKRVVLPTIELSDDSYFRALSGLAMAPGGLPDNLIETLFAIEETANPEGQQRLEGAVALAGLPIQFREHSSHGDIAVQVWLARPQLLIEQHNALRLSRLVAFEYYGSKAPVDRGDALASPGGSVLELLAADLDAWCQTHNRGEQTAHIQVFPMDGEFWFLVRHGDTPARTAKVERRKMEVLHFRPVKDDVVVYSPERDEIRIHAGTKGEKELYRRAFGQRLLGDDDHFCEPKVYTLEPLREDCARALDARGLPGVEEIVLREVQVAWGRRLDHRIVHLGPDLHASARACGKEAVPESGTVLRAGFDFHFAGQRKARRVELRTPNGLKAGRHCDARAVNEWLSERGFRVNAREAGNAEYEIGDGQSRVLTGVP